jgi:hypothetical protein
MNDIIHQHTYVIMRAGSKGKHSVMQGGQGNVSEPVLRKSLGTGFAEGSEVREV